ncbi:hypothetical protein PACTADRAFT_36405 [Pachysolen tannophilus NRRL Y-2460]|uniref:MPN domain-containing protein n=1 Tax=Pachysolen tannophilus NRRL Y-2460 TaxID=669874 RepID=A0A1E4U185_PACTA|nr:hypothetical protein PACTADRAFT_36405 [Pachysolen tannophilus NRRL Y-2460]
MSLEVPELHIVRPNLGALMPSLSMAPISVVIQSPALLQLIESSYSTNSNSRIIGTLLGSRSDDGSEVEVKDCYIVPHEEDGDEVIIKEYQHKALYQLYKKANPKEVILGWFATSPKIDTLTGLIHDFYSNTEGTKPYPAIHLTVQAFDENSNKIVTPIIGTYVGSEIGATGKLAASLGLEKSGSYFFNPIANRVESDLSEKTALSWVSKASNTESRKVQLPMGTSTELQQLATSVNQIDGLIDNISNYVNKVLSGEIKGDDDIGKFLLSNLTSKPSSISKESLEKAFNTHIQDSLMIEYLASSIKSQLELSAKLTNIIQDRN